MKRRWLVRILLIVLLIVFVLPLLIPLPPDGVAAETFADADGRFIMVNDLSVYVRERGDPDQPTVVLFHGWGGSTFSWRDQFDVLEEAGYHVIAFDRPPYGLSAKTGDNLPLSQEAQASFSRDVLDSLGIDRAILVGHSMGGGVIGIFAAMYPDYVESLVFVDGAPRVQTAETQTTRGGNARLSSTVGVPSGLVGVINFPPFERWTRILLRTFLQPDTFTNMQKSAYYDESIVTPEVAEGYQRQLQIVGWDEAMIDILTNSGGGFQALTPDDARAITAPALIVWGENDTWVPIASGETLAQYLPNAEMITYPETGHLPMEEQPSDFNRDLLAFLERNRQLSAALIVPLPEFLSFSRAMAHPEGN